MAADFFVGLSTANWAKALGLTVDYAPTSTSTNTIAKDHFLSDSSVLKLYLTDHQSAGRGRNANVWSAPPAGASLLSSWSFALSKAPQPIFSSLVGLALYNAARISWPQLAWSLKAPNDLYIGPKKVAGLLIETQQTGPNHRVIVGLGLNVFAAPLEVATATCIAQNLPLQIDEASWWTFLTNIHSHLIGALSKGVLPYLDAEDRAQLCAALNLNPLLEQSKVGKIVSVQADGSLETLSGLIQWSDL
jgi:BirA family biotin operon repressor/biotin-[acetyl-CoA-carboxylase] ligase